MSIKTWIVRVSHAARVAALALIAGGAALAGQPASPGLLPTTPGLSYRMYDAANFYTFNSGTTFAYMDNGRYVSAGLGAFGQTLNLPSGAAVEEITWYFIDDGPGGIAFSFYAVSPDASSGVNLGGTDSGATDTNTIQSVTLAGSPLTTIDDAQFMYRVEVDMDPGTEYRLVGMRVGYRLQVSPAPATATFNDVPTSDFAFQYIEALAASGITGGCGGGNYCPDNPVTRRQMAIFLAKALGLQWP